MQSTKEPDNSDLLTLLDGRFRGPLMGFFLRRIKNRAEAEDLTQEVFVRLLSTSEPNRIKHADAFVFQVAANLLIDRSRFQARRAPTSSDQTKNGRADELTSDLVEDRDPQRVLLSRETLVEALRMLDALGERTRDIFILFRLENMKQRDIAAIYGIAQSTVEKHVMKAALHLASRYGRE
jgi:RNA polymerase sigma-70 factor (ECF subfamily)